MIAEPLESQQQTTWTATNLSCLRKRNLILRASGVGIQKLHEHLAWTHQLISACQKQPKLDQSQFTTFAAEARLHQVLIERMSTYNNQEAERRMNDFSGLENKHLDRSDYSRNDAFAGSIILQEAILKKLVLATSVVAAIAAFSTFGASAAPSQTGQQVTTGNPMDAQAKMMMSKKKRMMMMKKKKMMMKKDGM